MGQKSDRINELETMLVEALTAFTDVLHFLHQEQGAHEVHHHSDEHAVMHAVQDLVRDQAEFINKMASEHLSPSEVVKRIAATRGYSTVDDSMDEIGMTILPVRPGENFIDAVKAKLESATGMEKTVLETLLNSGTADQLDAKIRDERNRNNASQN